MSDYLSRVKLISEDEQQQKVFAEDISRVVFAGPGSGKTFVLTSKVAKLLHSRTVQSPQRIMCLTYSRLLAKQLRKDIGKLISLDEWGRLFVGTVHSFCISEVLLPFGHLYGMRIADPIRIASLPERFRALSVSLERQNLRRPTRKRRRKKVLDVLDKHRKSLELAESEKHFDGIDPYLSQINWSKLASDYIEVLASDEIGTPSIDFVQVEIDSLKIIQEHALVRRALSACYPWWFIDEYQDLGLPFHRMIESLFKNTSINLLAIGDPDQCIYEELQGSNPQFIIDLGNLLEKETGAAPITLKTNYRNTQEIIDLSEAVLGEHKGYRSGLDFSGVCCAIETTESFEGRQRLIYKLLHKLIKREDGPNYRPDDIAVFYPYRQTLNQIADDLNSSGWKCQLDKDPDYDHSLELIEWIVELANWCASPIQKTDFTVLLPTWMELNTRFISGQKDRFELEKQLFDALWDSRDPEIKLATWLQVLTDRLGLTELVDQYGDFRPDEEIAFEGLRRAVVQSTRLSSWNLEQFAQTPGRIQLTTFFSSKGMQFDAAIVTGFDKVVHWERHAAIPLDYRLAYVAVSRAKTHVYLVYSNPEAHFIKRLTKNPPSELQFFSYDGQKVKRVELQREPASRLDSPEE